MQTVFLGNYSNNEINLVTFDNQMNIESRYKTRIQRSNPSYMCINNEILYSVSEIHDKIANSGYILAYKITNNKLKFLNEMISYGNDPCYVIFNELFNILFVANYTGGSFSAFEINEDGSIRKNIYKKHYGNKSRVHQIQFSNDLKRVYMVDLGLNRIIEYEINCNNSDLDLVEISNICFLNDEKPRHLVLDNSNNLYVITEKSCEIYKIKHNEDKKLEILEKSSILPNGVEKKSNYTGCAIKIDDQKEYIYVSIRGHNSISVFSIKNRLELIQNISCEGQCPRDIGLSKDEKNLICANQLTDNISIFAINNGILTFKNKYNIRTPTCICFK